MADTVLGRYSVRLYEKKPSRAGGGRRPLLTLYRGASIVIFAPTQEEEDGASVTLAELETFVRRCRNHGRCEAKTRKGTQCARHADVVLGFALRCTQHGG